MTLNRVLVVEPAVKESLYEGTSILYLKPIILDHEHVQQIETWLKDMNKDGNKKILLDLRDVSAGDMAEAVRLTNFFVNTGTIATLEGQKYPKQIFSANPRKSINTTAPWLCGKPRNLRPGRSWLPAHYRMTAAPNWSERRPSARVSMQKTFDLPDGGAIILSIAKYASPSGKQFEDDAVTPGTIVASNKELFEDDDSADDAATAVTPVTPDSPTPPANTPAKKTPPPTDDQFNKALDMLKAKAA